MPARSSSALLRAEMKMTGMSPKVGFFLIARQSSKPSIQLIITSSRITSGRSTCIAEMSRSPLAAWPTSNPSSSSASVSISRVSRSSSTMMTFGFFIWSSPGMRGSESGSSSAARRLRLERHGLLTAVRPAHQQVDPPLRLVELPRGVLREAHALGELLDRLLERELSGLELAHDALQPRDDGVVRFLSRALRQSPGALAHAHATSRHIQLTAPAARINRGPAFRDVPGGPGAARQRVLAAVAGDDSRVDPPLRERDAQRVIDPRLPAPRDEVPVLQDEREAARQELRHVGGLEPGLEPLEAQALPAEPGGLPGA